MKTKKGMSKKELQRQKDKHSESGERKNDSKQGSTDSTEEVSLYWTDEFDEGDILTFLTSYYVINEDAVDMQLESLVALGLQTWVGQKIKLLEYTMFWLYHYL